MCGSRKFYRRGSTFDIVILLFLILMSGEKMQMAIIGPAAKQHLDGVRWLADDGPTLNAGLVAL